MKISGAIFDMDGTLTDSMFVWKDVGKRYLISCGITPSEDLWNNIKNMSITSKNMLITLKTILVRVFVLVYICSKIIL